MRFHHLLFLSLFFFILPPLIHAEITPGDEGNFITTWNTENPGTSASNQITIPHAPGSTYHYDLYWENTASSTMNGTTTVSGSGAASSPTLIFPEPGIYRVEISGDFPHIRFANTGDRQKILTVEQWGGIGIAWTSMESAFTGATNLTVPATDAPNLGGVTSLNGMFLNATSFNEPINHWVVSNVTNMRGLFQGTSFNQPLDQWDVSSVTTMQDTFRANWVFNQPLNNWNVSNVIIFREMFQSAVSFNQPLDEWNTSSSTNMHSMFRHAWEFNQDISTWNVSNVTLFNAMFQFAYAFDQNLSNWQIDSATNMIMFQNVSLSPHNLDATLQSWASQATTLNKTNIPLNIGAKTYTSIGATALDTLRNLGWTITEQVVLSYDAGSRATLTGTARQQVNIGTDGTAVEVLPHTKYHFVRWSDGVTDNPRTDLAVTDHLTVSAIVAYDGGGACINCGTPKDKDTTQEEKEEEPLVREEPSREREESEEETPPSPDTETNGTLSSPDITTLINFLVTHGIISPEKADLAHTLARARTGTDITSPPPASFRFTRTLSLGDTHPEVRTLQQFLNTYGFTVAVEGYGSRHNETEYYGTLTKHAVSRFQEAHRADILTPLGLTQGTGYFGSRTLEKANRILEESSSF